MDGFRVDLAALTRASDGVQNTIEAMDEHQVRDIDCPSDAFGHDRLATVVADFCDQWDRGVRNLTDDAQEIAGRLADCAQVYRDTDETAVTHLDNVLRRANGDDPAQAW